MNEFEQVIQSHRWDNVKRSDLNAATAGLSIEDFSSILSYAAETAQANYRFKICNDDLKEGIKSCHPQCSCEHEPKTPFEYIQTGYYEAGKFIADQCFGLNHIGLISLEKEYDGSYANFHGTSLYYGLSDYENEMPPQFDWLAHTIYSLAGARAIQIKFGSLIPISEELNDAVAYYKQFINYPTSLNDYYDDVLNASFEEFVETPEGKQLTEIDLSIQKILIYNRNNIEALTFAIVREGMLLLSEMQAAMQTPLLLEPVISITPQDVGR